MISGFRNSRGFSLVELAVILMIVGLIAASAMETYRTWVNAKITGDNEANRKLVGDAMAYFVANYGRLPCPAEPGETSDAPTAGHENCLTANAAVGYCENNLCRRNGKNVTLAPVLIGTVPYGSLGLDNRIGQDGWGNKLTYAVTEALTNRNTYVSTAGSIGFLVAFRDDVTGQLTSAPAQTQNPATILVGTFMFVVVSHGADGRGAWTNQGQQPRPCGTYAVSGYDAENCDGDADFIIASAAMHNKVAGPQYFDDPFTLRDVKLDGDKWSFSTTNSFQNKTGASVAIGLTVPTVPLDVGGRILLEDFQANEYCSLPDAGLGKPAYCFSSLMIGAPTATAGAAQCGDATAPALMKGVDGSSSSKLSCVDVISTTALTPQSCPAGQYMKGITAGGAIICQAP